MNDFQRLSYEHERRRLKNNIEAFSLRVLLARQSGKDDTEDQKAKEWQEEQLKTLEDREHEAEA
jgi:hypothetical protein